MNLFLQQLSDQYPDKMIILICDNAVWHKARALFIPANIEMLYIPPYTPEMNPIERIWREFRRRGFVNRVFQTLEKVVDRLCEVIQGLTKSDVKSFTHTAWLIEPDLTMS
ncbi:transposase [Lacticaseibacillus sp. 53-4]|uniref:transposase n=1 Tax=Lacticaseibacillus sp. 53-4 TaxID=2799575 RepID=UPI0019413A95